MTTKNTRSRQRVRDLGEVFTAEREVEAMLDLVSDEAARLDSRFLEPSCGNGNFIVAILRRKLTAALGDTWHQPRTSPADEAARRRVILRAAASVYGIDICEQNVEECRQRVLQLLTTGDEAGKPARERTHGDVDYYATLWLIVDRNIVVGNFLQPEALEVSRWSFNAHGFSESVYRFADVAVGNAQPLVVHEYTSGGCPAALYEPALLAA